MIRHINIAAHSLAPYGDAGSLLKLNSESWEFLPWKKFQVNLFRLQKRVYKAVRAGDLQKLILRSQAARFLAIRQVTQLNAGSAT